MTKNGTANVRRSTTKIKASFERTTSVWERKRAGEVSLKTTKFRYAFWMWMAKMKNTYLLFTSCCFLFHVAYFFSFKSYNKCEVLPHRVKSKWFDHYRRQVRKLPAFVVYLFEGEKYMHTLNWKLSFDSDERCVCVCVNDVEKSSIFFYHFKRFQNEIVKEKPFSNIFFSLSEYADNKTYFSHSI